MSRGDKLYDIIAAAYQIAAVHGAPEHVLDVLARPDHATDEQIAAMLPYVLPKPQAVGVFEGYVDGVPFVSWLDRSEMPQPGDKLYLDVTVIPSLSAMADKLPANPAGQIQPAAPAHPDGQPE